MADCGQPSTVTIDYGDELHGGTYFSCKEHADAMLRYVKWSEGSAWESDGDADDLPCCFSPDAMSEETMARIDAAAASDRQAAVRKIGADWLNEGCPGSPISKARLLESFTADEIVDLYAHIRTR